MAFRFAVPGSPYAPRRAWRSSTVTARHVEAPAPPPPGRGGRNLDLLTGLAGAPSLGTMTRHRFAFAPAYRLPALALAITPATAWVDLDADGVRVRFGPWTLRTTLDNVAGAERTGGFSWIKTAGPPHLSFADRGVSFATNGADAACLTFHRRVPGIDPTRTLTHPGATLTVRDVPAFLEELARLRRTS